MDYVSVHGFDTMDDITQLAKANGVKNLNDFYISFYNEDETMTLELFAEKHMDRLYNPNLGIHAQSQSWFMLKQMVTKKETLCIKNMAFFHPNLRKLIIEHWDKIKNLHVST
jgi:hypothetical protein